MDKKTGNESDTEQKNLRDLLGDLRAEEPSELTMKRWQTAVRREAQVQRIGRRFSVLQLVAATFVGFIVGGAVFSSLMTSTLTPPSTPQINSDNATIEQVFLKLD